MCFRLALDLDRVLAAIAPVAALMPVNLIERRPPENPPSVMISAGTDDPLVPFRGGNIRFFCVLSEGWSQQKRQYLSGRKQLAVHHKRFLLKSSIEIRRMG